jgi:hypothetical protein
VVDGEFDARDQLDRETASGTASRRNAREGVVIREGKCGEADPGGLRDHHTGRVGPVGRRRVHVEVDRHRFS